PLEVVVDELPLGFDDGALAEHEVLDGDVVLDLVVDAVEAVRAKPGEVERRLAQRLRRDRAGVDGGAAGLGRLFDDADALPEVGSLRGSFLSSRAGADDDQVEIHY